jgi:hypothetical protein
VWSLLAALGLFVAGAAVSVTHGVHELQGTASTTMAAAGADDPDRTSVKPARH